MAGGIHPGIHNGSRCSLSPGDIFTDGCPVDGIGAAGQDAAEGRAVRARMGKGFHAFFGADRSGTVQARQHIQWLFSHLFPLLVDNGRHLVCVGLQLRIRQTGGHTGSCRNFQRRGGRE